ncbi:hypothetical protein BSF41_35740 [Flavobacterium sp. ACN2]|uniref:hypothetical protein n=1 Tax=Flavobacterium sp. ACN2 TaxID=1975676 RepID=UPI000BB3430A|nr:hypothetical protein [Flavobacterium sp. ACN2]PBI86090.1 hypothetical protein BSF41_35740 [Flavobacterium sp. ACN2]
MTLNWKEIKASIKKNIKKLNKICDNYQPTIQAIGIIVGLYIIYLTYKSVEISNYQLQLSLKQESQKELPIWHFEINDSTSIAKMKPFTEDVKLEIATAYFSEKLFFKKSNKWNIDGPDFNFHMTMLKAYLEKLVLANSTHKDSIVSISDRNMIPVGIEVSYIQYGQVKTANAIFAIQYTWIRNDEYSVDIKIDGIRFMRYLYGNENMIQELDKIIDKEFKTLKKPNTN